MNLWSFGRVRAQAYADAKIRGVQLGIVVDNKESDGNPGYRVKLKFPWLSEEESTFWARIAVPMAGPDRGTYVLPEIDDQVLVVFEHGDIDRPIVVGALWSKPQAPVEINASGKNHTKLIKSRSGHRVIFDDQEGGEKITIVDASKQNKIVLDAAKQRVQIEAAGDIEVVAKASAILHANALQIGTTQGVSGKGQAVKVHAQQTFGLKATTSITIGGGTTTINESGGAACNVSGTGAGELGGAAEERPRPQVAEASGAAGGGGASGAAATSGSVAPRGERAASTASEPPGALSQPSPANPPNPPNPIDEHQIEIQLVNKRGVPQKNVQFELTLPDGSQKTGTSGADGYIRISGIQQAGQATLSLPGVDAAQRTDTAEKE